MEAVARQTALKAASAASNGNVGAPSGSVRSGRFPSVDRRRPEQDHPGNGAEQRDDRPREHRDVEAGTSAQQAGLLDGTHGGRADTSERPNDVILVE